MTRPASSVVTPLHSPSGDDVFQLRFNVQSAPPVASYSASRTSRSPRGPADAAVVTDIVCVALRPSGSLAVTVTVAVPAVPGASHTVSPDTAAATTPAAPDAAA